jgi:NAD(P)-dependent dehydrogenase (short-subunit alcohol dehydrogenase family)
METRGVALVTGASRGIGRAVAVELAAHGFEAEAAARGGRLRVARLDVTDPSTIVIPRGLRVLVNNAGLEGEHHPVESTPPEVWRSLVETNFLGVVWVTARAIPEMRRQPGAVICNITSSSLLAPMPFFAPYRATKAAVSAFGESLRAELAPFGVRVVEILPGPIDTDMYRQSEQPMAALEHPAYRDLAARVTAMRAPSATFLTPTAEAAKAIVAAILDENPTSPLRHGCDPLSVGLLQRWREVSDEEMMRSFLDGMAAPAP